ncbi:uncharacterized protein RJT21DRAFT_6319 [Scheffersomyces amazonensis]|uniref:uncharacterized protein n=1 Tax=Scheffersomyces amazonensis TaxID=1078765 RepID=UPI00315D4903
MYQIMQKELQDVQTQQQGEMNKVNEKLEKIRDDDNERIRTLVSIMSTAKNEIRSMKIQLTKDEEKLLDVDILAKMYLILKKDLKMLRKSLVVPYKELRVSEIIESESDFLQNYDEDISKSNANETQNSDSCTSNGKNFNDSGSASQVQISSTDIKKVIENHVDKSDHSTLPMAIVDPNEIVAKKGSDEKNNQGITNKLNFDIATPEGRDALKNYLHISRRNKAGGICNNSLSCISTESDKENISFAAPNKISTANACGNTYADIQRYDFNTMKKFRRVFIEGRGWVSMSKIEEEERIYGSSSIILNEVNN